MESSLQSEFLNQICEQRSAFALPRLAREETADLIKGLLAVLFPHFTEHRRCHPHEVQEEVAILSAQLTYLLAELGVDKAGEITASFFSAIPSLHSALTDDADAMHTSDPASASVDEVIFAYPGFRAIAIYRLAHVFWLHKVPILPRLMSSYAHQHTGIDIHPGATIGNRFSIDHGTGVVIGATAVIGNGVRMYQGVTLGALAVSKSLADTKRHPTLEDDVVVYANATILGGTTVIGAKSVIGGNVWLTNSVPPGSRVTRSTPIISVDDPLEYYI